MKFDAVSIVPCANYQAEEVRKALETVLRPIGGLDWVKAGMKIVIKANLVSMMKPEKAATTHPALLCALVEMLKARGAHPIIGDSPGGLYNSVMLNRVYSATGMKQAEESGAVLNQNFEIRQGKIESAKVAHEFTYTAYLDEADAIINFCKLKSHGMMGMSAATKNMFGTVPGTFKPEYHFRYPDHADFARMLVDINRFFADKTKLCLVDAVVGMEGNGPTQGTPRHLGALLACASPYPLDLACAKLIGLTADDVPTLAVSAQDGLIPPSVNDLTVYGELDRFCVSDFQNIHVRRSLQFEGHGRFAAMFVRSALRAEPRVSKKECVGCRECERICPAHVITMKNKKPEINRSGCITCFCCQEFCPVGAMKVHRPLIARLINKRE